jgi:hypothetical protein
MNCRICGRTGANMSGFHSACFTLKVKQGAGTHSRTVFSGLGVKHETTDGPSSEEEWAAEERYRKEQREAQEQHKAEEEQEWHRKQAEENARWRQRYEYAGFGSWWGSGIPPSGKASTASSTTSVTVEVDTSRLRKLLMLCHPDKHENSGMATEVTRWLIEIKERMR